MSDGLIELQMPQMGESVTEGTILEWHVAEGEEVSEGDTVVEVSTDKIDAEVPAPASGVIAKILAQPDDTVEVGQVLAQIDTDAGGNGADPSPLKDAEGELVTGGGEGDEDLGDDSVESASAQPGQIETPVAEAEADDRPSADPAAPGGEAEAGGTLVVAMPEMGESVTEGTVLEWHVSEGQTVDEGDTVIEVSTDKVDAEVPAPASGTITKLLVNVDDTVQVGQALAEMAAGAGNGASAAAPAPAETETETETPPAAPAEVDQGNGKASPVARRIAAAKGIDLGAVSGSGPGGKVVKEDVLAAADGGNGAGPAVAAAAGEVKPLRGPAAMLAKAMDESRSVPTATSFRTLAVDTLDAKRKAINGALKDRGNEGLVHPPDRLGDRPRGNRVAGDGPQLQRGRRQAAGGRGAGGQPRDRGRRRAQGGPQPPGPVHQGRRERRLRRLPLALRGADHPHAREQAHRRRLPGDDDLAHQPRRDRDGRLGPEADEGTGDDRRHRLDRLPGRVGARDRRPDQGAGRVEGDDDDLDLRPPGDPGRRVGLVPAPASIRCSRARTTSTSRSPRRSAFPRTWSPTRTRPPPRRRRSAPSRPPPPPPPRSPASRTGRSCRRFRRRPRCSRPTAPTATWRRTSTRSAACPRATRRWSPRTST